jgi:predicted MFS family arabinose efflux permease
MSRGRSLGSVESPPGLRRNADFGWLWAGQAASQFGEQATFIIVPLIAILAVHASAGQVGLLRAVGQAPLLLLTLFAGAWVDGWRTRTVMMLADAGRAVVLGGLAVAVSCGLLGLPALLATAFAVGALSVLFDVAYQASLVRLVRSDQLIAGNSALEGTRSAAQVSGVGLGGVLATALPAWIAAAACAPLFALSSLSIRRIRHELPPVPRQRRSRRVWREIGEGLRFVAGHRLLRSVGLAAAAFQFFFAATMTLLLLFLTRELHLAGSAVGLVLAATGPGALAGSLLAARLPGRLGYGAVLVGAAALGEGVMLGVPFLRGPAAVTIPVLAAVVFVFGACGQLVDVTVMAIRQTVTPDGMQARVSATITFSGMGLAPLGSLLGGIVGQQWGVRASLLAAVVGMLLSPAVMAASPLVRLGRVLPGVAPAGEKSLADEEIVRLPWVHSSTRAGGRHGPGPIRQRRARDR